MQYFPPKRQLPPDCTVSHSYDSLLQDKHRVMCYIKRKGNDHPRTGHEGPEGEQMSRCIALFFFQPRRQMVVGGQRHAPAALPPGKNRYPLYRRLLYTIFLLSFLPLGATALSEPWPPQQSASITLYLSSSPSTALSSLIQVCYNIIHSSQTRSSCSSSYTQSSSHHLSWHRSLFHSLYMSQPSYSLSFYKFHNILPVYGSIQFFIISNSPDIPLLDRPIHLPQYFPFENP